MFQIVTKDGSTAFYQGTKLEFNDNEKDRAETILWLVNRNAANGPFYLVEVK